MCVCAVCDVCCQVLICCVSSGVFVVEVRGPGRIALHSMTEHNKYLRIKDGELNNGGHGGKWCDFYVHDVGK